MTNDANLFANAVFVEGAQRILELHAKSISGLELAILVSRDGFEISSVKIRPDLQTDKLSTIASSLMSMVQAVGREIKSHNCNKIIFEMDSSNVILQSIDVPQSCILCLVIKSKSILGLALWASGEIVRDISES